MPNLERGKGDKSNYWIIGLIPFTVKRLAVCFAVHGRNVGFAPGRAGAAARQECFCEID
jgi:hypothetical protein